VIYEYPDKNQPIKQGDIFYPLPLISLDLNKMAILSEKGDFEEANWQIIQNREKIVVNTPLKQTWGIVATQDCDASRAPIISLFGIGIFMEITGFKDLPKTPRKWVNMITQNSRLNARWFYLPSDEKVGFEERMAVNFHLVFHIFRDNLEQYVEELRKGRLNKVAFQHYRESIAQYFRRYPYDEWYPLNNDEFAEYNKEKGPVEPFEWQNEISK
jgi:hypothetical protein